MLVPSGIQQPYSQHKMSHVIVTSFVCPNCTNYNKLITESCVNRTSKPRRSWHAVLLHHNTHNTYGPLVTRRKASNKITFFPAVKITGTLPPLASTTPYSNTVDPVVSTRPHVEHCSSTSRINESLLSMTLPPLSDSTIERKGPTMVTDNHSNSDSLLDIMEFPTEKDDMELGDFLMDVAEWL